MHFLICNNQLWTNPTCITQDNIFIDKLPYYKNHRNVGLIKCCNLSICKPTQTRLSYTSESLIYSFPTRTGNHSVSEPQSSRIWLNPFPATATAVQSKPAVTTEQLQRSTLGLIADFKDILTKAAQLSYSPVCLWFDKLTEDNSPN